MSIPFSVSAASRTGKFDTSTFTNPGGLSTIYFELNVPTTAEYENAANGFTATLFAKKPGDAGFSDVADATWKGGHLVSGKGVTDPVPAFAWDVTALPTSTQVFAEINVTGTYTIGIQNGLIS